VIRVGPARRFWAGFLFNPTPKEGNSMKIETTETKKMVTFAVPAEVASAAQAVAAKELTSVSYLCRRSLLNELRQRGMLAGDQSPIKQRRVVSRYFIGCCRQSEDGCGISASVSPD
jgi:hypothetical protein